MRVRPDEHAGPRWSKLTLTVVVFFAVAGWALIGVGFPNDHFDRLSRARQIVAYGDHPFADFRDPGYFLSLYVSAAAQTVTWGSLLGEALLTSGAIAAASALTFWLAASASASLSIGVIAAFLTWFVPPRYYDFDKVLFYTAGLMLCWRYIDVPIPGRLVAAGVLTAVAALFRYDNALYLFAACVTAIVVRQGPSSRRLFSHFGFYVAACAATLAPALIFVHLTAGLPEAARQISTYAVREGQRSELFHLPALAFNESSVVYVMFAGMVALAIVSVAVQRRKHASLSVCDQKVLATLVLCACVGIFVLRDPITARVGAAVPLAVILAASVIGQWRCHAETARETRAWAMSKRVRMAALLICAVVLLSAFSQQGRRLLRTPLSGARRAAVVAARLAASPPLQSYLPDSAALGGMVRYLRRCTAPDARVLVTWFAPEVFFFAERGFAGGMAVFLGEHWSSVADQRRTIMQMESQRVPLTIVQTASEVAFRSDFPLVAGYLDTQYRLGGETSFDDPRVGSDGYRVLIRRDARNIVESQSGLPCPGG